ncbi:hypothetical protein FACS1894172_04310 [Spirochaetia bacterium]|nr:hypothetical protein FACS1894172_04310 [Spirochaetia bacterium]
MAEQRVVVTIDENGKINASTEGIKGEMCLDELQDLLGEIADLESISKTDEFYQGNELKTQNTIRRKL